MLKTTLSAMDPKEAETYLKKCIDSGLWVENVGEADDADEGNAEGDHEQPGASSSGEKGANEGAVGDSEHEQPTPST